MIMAWPSPR